MYNFTSLDQLITTLWENGLRPGFELMGNPSHFFDDFENKTQVVLWMELVESLAKHYICEFYQSAGYGLGNYRFVYH